MLPLLTDLWQIDVAAIPVCLHLVHNGTDDTPLNFLAHTLFAQQFDTNGEVSLDAELVVGQYCGDFVRSEIGHFPSRVQLGIRQHRAIDSYTDAHALNLHARNLFEKPFRRFAGVIVDVAYDHYLSVHWDRFSTLTLDEHAGQVYAALERYQPILPAALQRFSRVVIDQQVLTSYGELAAVERTLHRISRRSERFAVLAQGGEPLANVSAELEAYFLEFFPDLVSYASSLPRSETAVDAGG